MEHKISRVMTTLWLDTETYNEKPISHGTYAYAETCEVDIISWAVDDGPARVIDVANGPTGDVATFAELAGSADTVVAHNAMFDRNVLRFALGIDIPIGKWRCSMVRALAHGLPGSLDKLGEILRIEQDYRKMKEGKALMMLFCKPRQKNSKVHRATKHTHPEEWAKYLDYAAHDILAMRAISAKLPAWNYTFDQVGARPRDKELALWHLDQEINDRGFAVDEALVEGALLAVDKEQAKLKEDTRELTEYDGEGNGLGSTTQRDVMLAYLLEQFGLLLPDMRSATVEKLLEQELPDEARLLLEIRLQATSTSTSKYKALKKGVTRGRMRGTIQFDGAARTRRAAGRTFQPQNISRGTLRQEEIDVWVEIIKAGTEDLI